MKLKYTDEYVRELCEANDCTLINVQPELCGSRERRIVHFTCNRHFKYGEQSLAVDKFVKNKKKCSYCNHSRLKEIFPEEVKALRPNIEVLEEYSSWNTPIKCRCLICGYEWKGRAAVLLYGGDCPKCARKRANDKESLSIKEVKKRITAVNPSVEVIGPYTGSHKNLHCKCLIHSCEWESQPAHLFKGESGCPECKIVKMRKRFSLTQDEFQKTVTNKNPNIIVTGKYINNDTSIECSCLVHKNKFIAMPRNLLYKAGNACPLCFQSMGEQRLIRLLNEHGFEVSLQHKFSDCVYQKPLRFDAYDKENKIAYEYQGEQHYHPVNFNGYNAEKSKSDFELNQVRDQIKKDYCKNNNIHLIEIPYWEYDNMEHLLKQEWDALNITI